MSHYIVYPSSLFSLDLGYALWYPEPHKRTGEPQIGDVGYVHKGAFIRLFNINTSKPEHKITCWKPAFDVTETVTPDVFIVDDRDRPIAPGHYPSHGVRIKDVQGSLSAGFSDSAASISAGYTCKETHGALLVLQSEAHSEAVFECRLLKLYMARQHEHWCAYARDNLGHEVEAEDIVLVGGWVKTSADWAAMAFSNLMKKHYASLSAKVGGFMGVELLASRTRVQSGSKLHREGAAYSKRRETRSEDVNRDQSIFLRRYKIKRRLGLLKTVVAGAGYDQLPGQDGEDSTTAILAEERAPFDGIKWVQDGVVDPLDTVLDYILEVSDADVAVAYDQDMESMVGSGAWPLDIATYLRKVQPPVEVTERYGAISVSELIAREQLQRVHRPLITAVDLRQWPNITTSEAGTSALTPVQFGANPNMSTTFPSKWQYLAFDPPLTTDGTQTPVFASSPDGTLLASTSGARAIIVWRLSDGLSIQRLQSGGHTDVITSIAFYPDNRKLASASADTTIAVWDVCTAQVLFRLLGHSNPIDHVLLSTDGLRIISTAPGGIKFWCASTGTPICHYSIPSRVKRLVVSPDGSRLAGHGRRSVILFSINPGEPIVPLAVFDAAEVLGVTFAPSGDSMVILSMDDDRMGGQRVVGGRIYKTDGSKNAVMALESYAELHHAAFAPNGSELAATAYKSTPYMWDTARDTLDTPYSLDKRVTAVAYSPDGRFFAAAGGLTGIEEEGNVRAWSRHSQGLVIDLQSPQIDVEEMRFLPDSRRLLTISKQGTACLWNIGDALRVR